MTPFETIEIDGMVAACSGATGGPVEDASGGGNGRGGGAEGMLGHPKVYLNLAPAGRVARTGAAADPTHGPPECDALVPLGERLAGTVVAAVREDVGEPP